MAKLFDKHIKSIYKNTLIQPRGYRPRAELDPYLHGFWGEDLHTMTSQASMMGIPTFQLEIPSETRPHLAKNPEIMKGWARMIVDIYQNVIVPTWNMKETQTNFKKNLAAAVKEYEFSNQELLTLSEEYLAADKWSWIDSKMKKIVF